MNNVMPKIVRCRSNDFTLEICHGEIPDVCRLLWFEPVTEFELPDTKESDVAFHTWMCRYRDASEWLSDHLLRTSQCN